MEIDEHLFRRETPRLIAALLRVFGVHNLTLAEDVAQEAFCRALEVWRDGGVPANPAAWLMQTAKNRAVDVLRRQRTATSFASELAWQIQSEWTLTPAVEDLFSPHAVKDDLLRMMFSCCDPRLPEQTQIALILEILCGFEVEEVAAAFVSSPVAMRKRLFRAKGVLATAKRLFDVAAPEALRKRLPAVRRALYLLFNEGYHGASSLSPVRAELCREAMRLTALLAADPRCATPATHALGALMCLHAARLPARITPEGDLVALSEQDRGLWDPDLVAEGLWLLERSATGQEISEYHIEAAISSAHAVARQAADTDWSGIIGLYDTLMRLRPSPIVALNRAVAIAQRDGPGRGLAAIRAIPDPDRLATYPFYFAALGEFEVQAGNPDVAGAHFRRAHDLARSPTERKFLEGRVRWSADTQAADMVRFWEGPLAAFEAHLKGETPAARKPRWRRREP
jgi:RNA polymerase sigma-70 factor (ECF subfamily)